MSRTVVREAKRILSERGLVAVRQGVPSRVLDREMWDLLDPAVLLAHRGTAGYHELLLEVHEARMMLEPTAAEWAARKASPEAKAAIRQATEGIEWTGDTSRYVSADLAFHRAVQQASGNRIAYRALEPLCELFVIEVDATVRAGCTPLVDATRMEHGAVADAIVRSDPAGAAHAMSEHLERSLARFEQSREKVSTAAAEAPGRTAGGPTAAAVSGDPGTSA